MMIARDRGVRTSGAGVSQRQTVEELNRLGVKTPKGGECHLGQLRRALARLPAEA